MTRRWFAVVLPLCAGFSLVGLARGGIEGSKHDFTKKAWGGDNACAACHTPQVVETPQVKPLWDPGADLTQRFGLPAKSLDRAGAGTTTCLTCHDGTVAPSNVSTTLRTELVNKTRSARFAPAHGQSDHPVGVVYPQLDRGYKPVNTVVAKGTVSLPDGRVECISCHDPHNDVELPNFLVTSNARSALCLTCHRK